MKKLAHWALLLAALSTPGVIVAQEENAESTPAAAAEPQQEADGLSAAAAKLEELDKQVLELKSPSSSFTSRFERYKKEAQERLKKAEESRSKAAELRSEIELYLQEPYVFNIIPVERRSEYEEQGTALVKEVLTLLRGKEPDQVQGIEKFELLRTEYQGIPGFTEALDQYKKVVDKLEKKWTAAKERVTKERAKYSASTKQKVEDAEQAAYKRQVQKMEAVDKDIHKDWFVPTSTMMTNLPLLDALLQHARTAKRNGANPPAPEAGKVPEMLNAYWESADAIVQKLHEGNLEEVLQMLGENKAFQDISMVNRSCMPEKLRQELREQNTELRNDIRKRVNEARARERVVQRATSDAERELRYVESRLENIAEDIDREKEEMARKAEEEAERKAEEEAERLAEEEEAAEDDKGAQDSTPKKTKKKRKKKSASKKADTAED